jgi:hypothetical protein
MEKFKWNYIGWYNPNKPGQPFIYTKAMEIDEHNRIEEFDPHSDCGGWTYDPPCGGCNRCMHMQISYYYDEHCKVVARYAKWGIVYAPVFNWYGGRNTKDMFWDNPNLWEPVGEHSKRLRKAVRQDEQDAQ